MTRPQEYTLANLSTSTPGRRLSSNSRNSDVSERDASDQNPFSDQDPDVVESQSTHPYSYDPPSADLLSNTNQQHSLYRHLFSDGWGWEMAAWLLAAVSLAALLIVFVFFADKPLDQWQSVISPGTVVAILSQLGQTAIVVPLTACICQSMWLWLDKESQAMQLAKQVGKSPRLIGMQEYDYGSRGPLGSLALVYKHPKSYAITHSSFDAALTRSRALVWLGTINTFLVIFYGTFTQQSLQLPSQQYNRTELASIPRSLHYSSSRPRARTIMANEIFSYESVSATMSLAVAEGLLPKDRSPSDIAGNCPTGNCTWELYQTMGVCSNVIDVSSSITHKCQKNKTPFHQPGCNYSVPAIDKNSTVTGKVFETYQDILWVGASNPSPPMSLGSSTPPFTYPEINTLVQFYVIYVSDRNKWQSFDHTEPHKDELVALQATLSLCLYTYNTSVTLFATETTTVSKETGLDWQTGEVLEDIEVGSKKVTKVTDTVTTTHHQESFWCTKLNMRSFFNFLSAEIFTGSVTSESAAIDISKDNKNAQAVNESIHNDNAGIKGLSRLLDNLAISMTNAYALSIRMSYIRSLLTSLSGSVPPPTSPPQ